VFSNGIDKKNSEGAYYDTYDDGSHSTIVDLELKIVVFYYCKPQCEIAVYDECRAYGCKQ